MKQLIAALCAAVVLLSGLCGWQGVLLAQNVIRLQSTQVWQLPEQEEQAPAIPQLPQQPQTPPQQKPVSPMGSVGLLTDRTLLVSLYLNTAESQWTVAEKAQMQVFLQKALSWMDEQAAEYGKRLSIVSELDNPRLQFSMKLDGAVPDGTENIPDSFDSQVLAACTKLSDELLTGQYQDWNLGFVVLLPTAGQDFTMVYEPEYEGAYYYEYSVFYQYDIYMDEPETWTGPATMAHELLHLFGAYDLYEGTTDTQVSPELISYVERNCPGEIMYYTYNDDNSISYDGVHKEISALTAYRVGLTDQLGEFAQFEAIAGSQPGIFGGGHLPGSQAA